MTPNQLQDRASAMLALYAEAEETIMRKVARRITRGIRSLGRNDGWAERKLREAGAARRDIADELRRLNDRSQQLREDLLNSAYASGHDAMERELAEAGRITNAVPAARLNASADVMRELERKFNALHSQILRDNDDQYRDIVGRAVALQSTGVISTREAVKRALEDFADRGITGFTDRAGRHWNMDTYAEMACRTGMMNAAVQGYTEDAIAHDEHLVIVSDHQDTCPICAEWERAVLAIDDIGRAHPDCEGTLSEAEGAGLFHPNCLHSVTVYVPGLTIREGGKARQGYTREMDLEGYQNRQKQRYMERQVRRWKRRQAVATTPEDERFAKAYADRWQRKLRELTDDTDLPRKYDREGGRVKLSEAAKKLKPVRLTNRAASAANADANIFLKYQSVEEFDRAIEALRAQRQAMFDSGNYNKLKTDKLLEEIFQLESQRGDWIQASTLASGDTRLTNMLRSSNPVEVMRAIDQILNNPDLGLPASHWNGEVRVRPHEQMWKAAGRAHWWDNPADGAKDGGIDLKEGYLYDYTTSIHENLHQRSRHDLPTSDLVDALRWHRSVEEGSVQLMTEEVCKRLGYEPRKTYSKQVDALRDLHKLIAPRISDYDFARRLIDRSPLSRYNYIVERIQDYRAKHPRMRKAVEKRINEIEKIFEKGAGV